MRVQQVKFLFLEPFFGGSHRDFAKGLVAHSRHTISLLTLPARFWKWRMRGAALYFFKKIDDLSRYDGIITSGLMSLSDFKMLAGPACPPALVYFHENQITYPLAPGEAFDVQFGFTDITTGLAADKILFNSRFHLKVFFDALPGFLRMMPERRPNWIIDSLREKSAFCFPGCRFSGEAAPVAPRNTHPPLIIWNHRWEFDKNPSAFFDALAAVRRKGIDFRLALLGENFQVLPKPFLSAKTRFKKQLVHYGYVDSRKSYNDWLCRGDVVVSTANQENFGISVVEAVRHGCLPLLPNRLAYPEVLPQLFHDRFLYRNQEDLEQKLATLLNSSGSFEVERRQLSEEMRRYAWRQQIRLYDDILEDLAQA